MTKIKFGTDGWRAIIAKDYTVGNVIRVSEATAIWMEEKGMDKVVIGYDCRFGGLMFSEYAARVFGTHNIKVIISTGFVSTPMVSLGVVKTQSDVGVVITASHNPPTYNGYKLKSAYGGPTIPKEIAEVEEHVPAKPLKRLVTLDSMREKGLLEVVDLEEIYYQHVRENFDLDLINNSAKIAYDAMYGAGQRLLPRVMPGAVLLHCENNPSFMGQAPEPIARNLSELSELIKNDPAILAGLANDGDADRIGMYDEDGNFVDSHHLLLLLLYYMHRHKGLSGKVVVTFSVTNKMKLLADKFGLDFEVTKIGFKHIAEIMIREDVLVGGEESGGLAVKGHIPERDGIWMGLLIFEFMAKTGKSLKQLVELIHTEVGSFSYDRDDLHISQELKESVVQNCRDNTYTSFGNLEIQSVESIDGFKYFLDENTWVLIRPSGTEPVLRVYCQAENKEKVRDVLDTVKSTLLG